MKFSFLLYLFLPAFLCQLTLPAWADSDLKIAVDSAYEKGQYERVELLVLRSKHGLDSLTAADQANIYLKTGFAMIMLNRDNDARTYFTLALDANPSLQLDPVRVSPIFRTVFDEVKTVYRPRPAETAQGPPDTGAGLRKPLTVIANLTLPGSGHWMEGRYVRGSATFVVQLLTAALFTVQMEQLSDARDRYIREADRLRVPTAYDRYYDEYRKAWWAGAAMGIVYLGSQVDLALTRPSTDHSNRPSASLRWIPTVDGGWCQVAVRW